MRNQSKPTNSSNFATSLVGEVVETPIFVGGKEVKDYKAIVCSETGTIFNIPKKTYTPVTNAQFVELTEEFARVTGFKIDGYAQWKGGAKVLAYLRKGGNGDKIMGFDCENHAVLSNAHDGRGAFWVGYCNKFARCRNEFGRIMELASAKSVRLTHSKHSQDRLAGIQEAFSLYDKNLLSFEKSCEMLATIKVNKEIKKGLLKTIGLEDKGKENTTRMANILKSFEDCLAIEAKDLGGQNAFAYFNAVTRYTTHVRTTKDKVYGKFHSTANSIDNKAFEYLKAMLPDNFKKELILK